MLSKGICIILAVFLFVAPAAESATLVFWQGLVQTDPLRHEIRYAEAELTPVGSSLGLSQYTYLIELRPGEEAALINWSISEPRPLTKLESADPWCDIPTSLDPIEITPPPAECILGGKSVLVNGQVRLGDRQYGRIMIFPVTIDSIGHVFFVDSLSISVGERLLSQRELLTRSDIETGKQGHEVVQHQSSSTGAIEYVIITDSLLLEQCERLAEYKNSTGFSTTVALIGDILPSQTGRDDAEKLRNYLKSFHQDGGIYALMAGDETLLPIRYTYHRSTSVEPGLSSLKQCDLYFADLTGDWNADDDNVWGEPMVDDADLVPELRVGRLPFNSSDEMSAYVDKLIVYETDPGKGQPGYLEHAFFFSSDQMRDYGGGGQHGRIAAGYPDQFEIDTTHGVEVGSGYDPSPYNESAVDVVDDLSLGFGIINILAHGSSTAFGVRTSGYNHWPKSFFLTDEPSAEHASLDSLDRNHRTGLYYSLACDGAAFDKDQPPINFPGYPLCAQILSLPEAGAVALVGYSRNGWVGTSHYLQKTFFDSLFAHPERPAVDAMIASLNKYYYYRDLVYAQNYLGDPTLRVYTTVPSSLSITIDYSPSGLTALVTSDGLAVDSCLLVLSATGVLIEHQMTDADGSVHFSGQPGLGKQYTIAAVKVGYSIARTNCTPSIVTDVLDETDLPAQFELAQNYPNPFNPSTSIEFELAHRSEVDLSIFNVLGRKVATIAEGSWAAGRFAVEWNAIDQSGQAVGSGVYFYRLTSDQGTRTRKMLLVR